jgi:hypothetical protein
VHYVFRRVPLFRVTAPGALLRSVPRGYRSQSPPPDQAAEHRRRATTRMPPL